MQNYKFYSGFLPDYYRIIIDTEDLVYRVGDKQGNMQLYCTPSLQLGQGQKTSSHNKHEEGDPCDGS